MLGKGVLIERLKEAIQFQRELLTCNILVAHDQARHRRESTRQPHRTHGKIARAAQSGASPLPQHGQINLNHFSGVFDHGYDDNR